MRRQGSARNLAAASSRLHEVRGAQQLERSDSLAQLADVDCGCCTVTFTASATPSDLPCLEIRSTSSTWGRRISTGGDWFLAVLRRVLGAGVDFVAVFDFRKSLPGVQLTRVLANLCADSSGQWKARVRSVALLVQENILDAATKGPVANFVQASLDGCPFVVCHSKAAAEEFFRAELGASPAAPEPCSAAPFVSVVDVVDGPPSRASRTLLPDSSCLAALAPFRPRAGSTESDAQAHAFHVLPNGDMRVIQSPPTDMVQNTEPQQGKPTGRSVKHCASSDIFAECKVSAVAALKFECPREQLLQLIGAHFHFGELLSDAEIQCISRGGLGLPIYVHKGSAGCLYGAHVLARKLFRTLLATVGGVLP